MIVNAHTRRQLPRRVEKITTVVVHATGETDLEKILRWYRDHKEGCGPHYFIAVDGRVFQHADENEIAWHCKIDEATAELYRLGYAHWSRFLWAGEDAPPRDTGIEQPRYARWKNTWAPLGVTSPLGVAGRSPNYRSVGIELQSSEVAIADGYTDAQYASLTDLLALLCMKRKLHISRSTVVGHEDCDPIRRHYDPGVRFRWNRVFDTLRPRRGMV